MKPSDSSTPPRDETLPPLSLVQRVANFHMYGCDATEPPYGRACSCGTALNQLRVEVLAALTSVARSESGLSDPFSRLASLIADINIDRYGKPLVAALHLCNDLADEVASKQSANTSSKAVVFDADRYYREYRDGLYGAGWQRDETTSHEHVDSLEATVNAALNVHGGFLVVPADRKIDK